MLFNKDNKGSAELKELVGFVYKSNKFDNIKVDIELAEEEIIKIIGQPVYNLADNYYNNVSEDSGSGSASGSGSGSGTGGSLSEALLDKLVKHIQLPVALFAIKSFSENTDVSHEDTGRKVKIDDDSEKLPWEWMLDRDDAALLNKAYKTTDRLIAFLEKYENNISAWKNSEAQKSARSCFIKTAAEFDELFPIDKSRRFYLTILPFMKNVEKDRIKPMFDKDEYDIIKEAIKSGQTSDYDDVIFMIKEAVAPLTMAKAVKRLSLQIIPEGVIQNWISDRLTSKAKAIPQMELINNISRTFEQDGDRYLFRIQEYLRKQDAEEAGTDFESQDVIPENDKTNKYFRT